MTNFVLIYSGGGMPEGEAETAAVMGQWANWYEHLGPALVDGGYPFTSVARTIAPDGRVTDASFDSLPSGYTIVKAESLDQAVELAKGCPILASGGSVSVFETFDVGP